MRQTLFLVVAVVTLAAGIFLLRQRQVLSPGPTIPSAGKAAQDVQPYAQQIVVEETDAALDPSTVEQALKDNKYYYRSPSLVAENEDDHMEIDIRGRQYRIDFDKLPVTKDDCPDFCVKAIGVVAFDEPRGRVLLDVPTDTWKNVPMIMVGYELSTGAFTRYGMTEGVGLREGTASKSGRYLAFVSLSTGGGSCNISSRISVIDTQLKNLVQLEPPSVPETDVIQMGGIKWTGESELSYQTWAFKRDDCLKDPSSYATKEVTTRVNLANLKVKG